MAFGNTQYTTEESGSPELFAELFYGDEYGIMGEVVKQVFARQDEFVADPHTFRELEIVRQTLIAVEKMKKNGDCIAEGELGDAVTVSVCGGSDENN